MANYRNKKLLDLCHELPCQRCGVIDGTICAAHSNQQRDGKGTGIKAHDYRIAALCNQCHFEIDNGKNMSKEQKRDEWELAHRMTLGYMFEHNMIGIK